MELLFISCGTNLEDLLFKELESLGIQGLKKGFRGIFAPKTLSNMYRINFFSYLATRVLWPLMQFHTKDREDLYRKVARFPWDHWIAPNQTFAIDANVHHKDFKNSLFAAQVAKDAICDVIRKAKGERPSIDTYNPDIQLNLFLNEKTTLFSFDTSGVPLFKRGYKEETVEAPIQESLAAALLTLAGYTGNEILCDPFCGSGTIVIEALMKQHHLPSGAFRKEFGFLKMPIHDAELFASIKKEAKKEKIEKLPLILANDKDIQAIHITKKNVQSTHLASSILYSSKDIAGYFPDPKPNLIITNPPYGLRLSLQESLYHHFAEFLKNRCAKGARAFLLSTNPELLEKASLKILSSQKLNNGGVDVDFVEVCPNPI